MSTVIGTMMQGIHPFIRYVFIATIIAIPLSVKFYFPSVDVEVIFPAEPLIGALFVLVIAAFLFERTRPVLDQRALKHPITLLVAAYVLVSLASMIGTTLPMVSIKATVVRVIYVAVFYAFLTCFRRSGEPDVRVDGAGLPALLRMHGHAFLAIVLYALINQFREGADRPAAGLAPFPFYIDHTIYSAALVFVLLISVSDVVRSFTSLGWRWPTVLRMAVSLSCVVALYFSFCRAAWLSVVACMIFLLLWRSGVRYKGFLLIGLAVLLVVFFWSGPIMARIAGNTVNSNIDNAGFKESVLSMTNISTDVSNTERLNRWSCAYRMFLDKPLLGFGPGTFQFSYLPYQRPEEKTYLSAADLGNPGAIQRTWSFSDQLYVRKNPQLYYYSAGTAHSEYLLALSEGGILSFLVLVGLLLAALRTGLRLLASPADASTWALALAALLGILAYFVHGLFNNFLDDCKLAFLFWGSLGVLTTLDLRRTVVDRDPT